MDASNLELLDLFMAGGSKVWAVSMGLCLGESLGAGNPELGAAWKAWKALGRGPGPGRPLQGALEALLDSGAWAPLVPKVTGKRDLKGGLGAKTAIQKERFGRLTWDWELSPAEGLWAPAPAGFGAFTLLAARAHSV